jgi:hypothetical protein
MYLRGALSKSTRADGPLSEVAVEAVIVGRFLFRAPDFSDVADRENQGVAESVDGSATGLGPRFRWIRT